MKISVTVCDMCEPEARRDAITYTVGVDGETYSADLCPDHAEPLRQAIGLGKPASAQTVRTVGSPPKVAVKRATKNTARTRAVKSTTKRAPAKPRKGIASLMVSLDEIENLKD